MAASGCPTPGERDKIELMEIQPITYEEIIEWLREGRSKAQIPIIFDSRLAISLIEAQLLAIREAAPLRVIPY
jgi:hypothetical protein